MMCGLRLEGLIASSVGASQAATLNAAFPHPVLTHFYSAISPWTNRSIPARAARAFGSFGCNRGAPKRRLNELDEPRSISRPHRPAAPRPRNHILTDASAFGSRSKIHHKLFGI